MNNNTQFSKSLPYAQVIVSLFKMCAFSQCKPALRALNGLMKFSNDGEANDKKQI